MSGFDEKKARAHARFFVVSINGVPLTVVVAQVVEWSLPTPVVRCSNPISDINDQYSTNLMSHSGKPTGWESYLMGGLIPDSSTVFSFFLTTRFPPLDLGICQV